VTDAEPGLNMFALSSGRTLLRRDRHPSLHVGMEAAIIVDDTGLCQYQACRAIGFNRDIKAAAHSGRSDPRNCVPNLCFEFRRGKDKVVD
jgi:hypothetical protein